MSILLSVAASLLLSYGGVYGAEAAIDGIVAPDHGGAEATIADEHVEPVSLRDLTEGHPPA